MQVTTRRIDHVPGDKPLVSKDKKILSFYNNPPNQELSLDEFEKCSFDRLQLLRKIESYHTRGFEGNELRSKIDQAENVFFEGEKSDIAKLERQDVTSHFILRLAYCRTEELRRWFIQQECLLFRRRLDRLENAKDQKEFMESNGILFEVATSEARNDRKEYLLGLANVTEMNFLITTFYKIPFQQALSLIGSRQVYLEKGYAWIPIDRLMSIIVTRFKMNLSRALTEAMLMFDNIASDTRIGPMLKNMNKQFLGKDFSKLSNMSDKLTAERVDQAADVNMPLCAKYMHKNLKAEHKLKHWARQQYGLFLKGAGLSMEDALIFWESHFAKIMSHDDFMKKHSYNIRHNYGKEGARKDYTPPSCNRIILGTPPEAGAYHGCPYRHLNDKQLVQILQGLKIGLTETTDIVNTAKSGHYQIACLKHFEIAHPGHQQMDLRGSNGGDSSGGSGGNNFSFMEHPNKWYKASVQYHKVKSAAVTAATASTSTTSGVNTISSGGSTQVSTFNNSQSTSSSSSQELLSTEVGKRGRDETQVNDTDATDAAENNSSSSSSSEEEMMVTADDEA